MRKIIASNQMGKTATIMNQAKANWGLVITFSENRAMELRKEYQYDNIMSIQHLMTLKGRSPAPIYIDDADLCLQSILSGHIKSMSLNI